MAASLSLGSKVGLVNRSRARRMRGVAQGAEAIIRVDAANVRGVACGHLIDAAEPGAVMARGRNRPRVGLVRFTPDCGALVWQDAQLRMSCGNATVEKSVLPIMYFVPALNTRQFFAHVDLVDHHGEVKRVAIGGGGLRVVARDTVLDLAARAVS